MNTPSHIAFRLGMLVFASVLGVQSIWLTLAEISRSSIRRLPTDVAAAAAAFKQRDAAASAARVGGIRGELWAEFGLHLCRSLVRQNFNQRQYRP